MRHRVKGFKLGRTASHRKAMYKNMSVSIIDHERIITTQVKAKAIKPEIEKLITLAKTDTQHNRRRAFAQLRDGEAVEKLFDVLGPRFADRPGGYCRVIKLARRRLGDAGERAIIEFVERTKPEAPPVEAEAEAVADAE